MQDYEPSDTLRVMENDGVIEEEFDLAAVAAEKRKFERKDVIFIVAVLVLVAGVSFGLGRLSALTSDTPEVKFENILGSNGTSTNQGAAIVTANEKPAAVSESTVEKTIAPGGQYVASKKGAKYHLPWCAGAKQISEENKIWFASKADAEKAGYTPASNCKGI